MRKTWKKAAFALLAFAVCLCFVTGPAFARGQKEGAAAGQKPLMEISWMYQEKEKTWTWEQIEKKFNVKLTTSGFEANETEKVNLMLASGEATDVLCVWDDSLKLFNDGITRTIPKDFIKKYMPNYTKVYDANPMSWLLDKNPKNENEYLNLQSYSFSYILPSYFTSFRLDWARKLGIDLPNFDAKKIPMDGKGHVWFMDVDLTVDWFEKLLVAFRDGDADGNGKIDTLPMSGTKYAWWTWGNIIGAFGLHSRTSDAFGGFNYMENGEVYLRNTSPRFKEFLALAAKWYKMGLVDKEFPTMDLQPLWDKVTAGKVGVSFYTAYDVAGNEAYKMPPNNLAPYDQTAAKQAIIVEVPPPIGPRGFRGDDGRTTNISGMKQTINKKVNDEKLARILEITDWLKGSNEGFIYSLYGNPGVHSTWSGEPWKSQPVKRKKEEVPAGNGFFPRGNYFASYPGMRTLDQIPLVFNKQTGEFVSNYMLNGRIGSMVIRPYKYDYYGQTNVRPIQLKYGPDLNTLADEFALNVITGQKDLNAEWDAYVAKYMKNGGSEILAEIKKAPIVEEMLKGKVVY